MLRICIRADARTTPSGDEIHHGTGDVLLMVTVGDPGWAGCARCGPTDVGLDSGPLPRLSFSLLSSSFPSRRRINVLFIRREFGSAIENRLARTRGDCRAERVNRAIAARERAPIDLRACLTLYFTTAGSRERGIFESGCREDLSGMRN